MAMKMEVRKDRPQTRFHIYWEGTDDLVHTIDGVQLDLYRSIATRELPEGGYEYNLHKDSTEGFSNKAEALRIIQAVIRGDIACVDY